MSTNIFKVTKPAGSNGELQFNNGGEFGAYSNLFWDNVNKRLGINETFPSAQLHVTPTSSLSTHEVAKFGTVEVRGDGRIIADKGTTSSTYIGNTNGVGDFNCTAVGFQAGNALVFASSNNTLIGGECGETVTGVNNSALGMRSLQNAAGSFQNTAMGNETLRSVSTGNNNTAFGFRAGTYIGTGTTSLTSADNSLFLGYQSRANGNGETNQVVIGYNTVGLGSNTTRIGNSSTTLTKVEGTTETAKQFKAPTVTGGVVTANTFTFDCDAGTTQKLDLQAATGVTTLSFSNQIEGNTYTLVVVQGSGTYDLTLPSGWWLNDTAPFDFTTLADNDRAMVTATYLDSEWYFAVKQLTQVV